MEVHINNIKALEALEVCDNVFIINRETGKGTSEDNNKSSASLGLGRTGRLESVPRLGKCYQA